MTHCMDPLDLTDLRYLRAINLMRQAEMADPRFLAPPPAPAQPE